MKKALIPRLISWLLNYRRVNRLDGFKEIRKKKKLAMKSEMIMEQVKSDLDQVYNNLSVLDKTLSLRDKSQSRERTQNSLSRVLAKTLAVSNSSQFPEKSPENKKSTSKEEKNSKDKSEKKSEIKEIEDKMARSSDFTRKDLTAAFRKSAEKLYNARVKAIFQKIPKPLTIQKNQSNLNRSIEFVRPKKKGNYIRDIKKFKSNRRGIRPEKRLGVPGRTSALKKRSKSRIKSKFNMVVLNSVIKRKKSYTEKGFNKEQKSLNEKEKDRMCFKRYLAGEKEERKKKNKGRNDKKKGENLFGGNKNSKNSKRFIKFSYNTKIDSRFFFNKFAGGFNKPTIDITLNKYRRFSKLGKKEAEKFLGSGNFTGKEKGKKVGKNI